MYKYIIKRILIAIPVLIGITVIDYAIMCMAGSPLAMMQGRLSAGNDAGTACLTGCVGGKEDRTGIG